MDPAACDRPLYAAVLDQRQLARSLGDGGDAGFRRTNPVTGRQVIDSAPTCRILSVMATAGLYDDSGKWLFKAGLPAQERRRRRPHRRVAGQVRYRHFLAAAGRSRQQCSRRRGRSSTCRTALHGNPYARPREVSRRADSAQADEAGPRPCWRRSCALGRPCAMIGGSGARSGEHAQRLALSPHELRAAGPRPPALHPIMGDKVGRPLSSAFRSSRPGPTVSGDYAPTYYLDTDAPLYYYSFTDALSRRRTSRSRRGSCALRSDDHRLQSGRTCTRPIISGACSRPFPACSAASASSRSTRNSCRRKSPASWPASQSRARPHLRFRRRGRAGRDHPQRHRHAVREDRHRAALFQSDEGPARGAIRTQRSSGRTPASAASSDRVARHATPSSSRSMTTPRFSHVYFDISWDEVAKYVMRSPRGGRAPRICSTATQIASCSAPTWSRRRRRPRTWRVY